MAVLRLLASGLLAVLPLWACDTGDASEPGLEHLELLQQQWLVGNSPLLLLGGSERGGEGARAGKHCPEKCRGEATRGMRARSHAGSQRL